MNFRSGCEDRPDMERPKIQMLVDDGEEEELVELAAPSADAAIRLKLGDTFSSEKPFKSKNRDNVALDRSNLNLKKVMMEILTRQP